jgi:gluconate 2-dehydrogenase gamma chain
MYKRLQAADFGDRAGGRPAMRRRAFLGAGFSAAIVGSTVGCGSGTGQWRFFTPAEARTLEAVCAQLIPADRDPGAKEAGVVNYIDIQLTRVFRKHRAAYRRGLAAIDAESRARAGKLFADLQPPEQTEALNAVEEKSQAFFDLMLTHTRQGFYGDPRHGGNRNMVSWKMLGLPFPPVRGRQHYEAPKVG